MSLHALKETLRPCTTQQPSTSSISQSQTRPISILHDSHLPIIPRKPPKSSLSQQLRRLHDEESFCAPPLLQPHNSIDKREREEKSGEGDNGEEEQEEEEKEEEDEEPEVKRGNFGRAKMSQFQFDHTGPFEPLVLSSDEEVPVVQVFHCVFFFNGPNSCIYIELRIGFLFFQFYFNILLCSERINRLNCVLWGFLYITPPVQVICHISTLIKESKIKG